MCENVRIERMSYGSAAIAHKADGKTLFVEGAAPLDLVNIEILEEKPTFARARVTEIVEASPLRTTEQPNCPAACGGCPWAHLSYDAQLDAKRSSVVDSLTRIGKFDAARAEELVAPCVGSKRQWGYRNKLELAVITDTAGRFTLGYHREGSNEIIPVATCPLAHKAMEKAPKALQGALRFAQGNDDLGIYRIGVRTSVRTKDMEVALWTAPGPFPRAHIAKTVKSALKATSIVRVMADPGKARKIKGVETLDGKGCWEEKLLDAKFLTSAPSFFQVNTAQAEKMVELVLEGLGDVSEMLVADLYSGGGTFSIPLALAGADVIAVESAGSSVRDLRRNAQMANVDIEVIGGDTARELPELGELDALVVDPPRSGLADGIVESIAEAAPTRVAYVSCNPSTWARDVKRFEENGYVLEKATPVDLFPQTYHVETVSILARS